MTRGGAPAFHTAMAKQGAMHGIAVGRCCELSTSAHHLVAKIGEEQGGPPCGRHSLSPGGLLGTRRQRVRETLRGLRAVGQQKDPTDKSNGHVRERSNG